MRERLSAAYIIYIVHILEEIFPQKNAHKPERSLVLDARLAQVVTIHHVRLHVIVISGSTLSPYQVVHYHHKRSCLAPYYVVVYHHQGCHFSPSNLGFSKVFTRSQSVTKMEKKS
jgi:hypothetical protein